MVNKFVNIIIPVYNRAAVISRTLDSFINQTYANWECIVVDDNSTDNISEVLSRYMAKDNRIKYIKNKRTKGAQGARNTGILHAKYDWVCLFDSDDYAYPDFLSKMVNALSDEVDVVTSYLNLIDTRTEQSKVLKWGGDGDLLNPLLDDSAYVAFNMAIIRKSKLMQINLLDECCPAYQEYDTHIRLSQVSRYKSVKEPLSNYYFCSFDSISANAIKNTLGLYYIYEKHRKLWRKNKYWAYLKKTRDLFAASDRRIKMDLLLLVPELILFYPLSMLKKSIGRCCRSLK